MRFRFHAVGSAVAVAFLFLSCQSGEQASTGPSGPIALAGPCGNADLAAAIAARYPTNQLQTDREKTLCQDVTANNADLNVEFPEALAQILADRDGGVFTATTTAADIVALKDLVCGLVPALDCPPWVANDANLDNTSVVLGVGEGQILYNDEDNRQMAVIFDDLDAPIAVAITDKSVPPDWPGACGVDPGDTPHDCEGIPWGVDAYDVDDVNAGRIEVCPTDFSNEGIAQWSDGAFQGFLDEVAEFATLDCDVDEQAMGWRGQVWKALTPVHWLLEVDRAYGGREAGAFNALSVFQGGDEDIRTREFFGTILSQGKGKFQPVSGAVIQAFIDGVLVAQTSTDRQGNYVLAVPVETDPTTVTLVANKTVKNGTWQETRIVQITPADTDGVEQNFLLTNQ